MLYYDRKSQKYKEEIENNAKILNFLYNNGFGRALLKTVVARPFVSNLRAIYQNSPKSKKDIVPFIEKYKIDIDISNIDSKYNCFNDFFTRKKELKKEKCDANVLTSPADCKMQFFPITDDLQLKIKNSVYDVKDILDNKHLAGFFNGGTCVVCRLCVDDYHRYHHFDNGQQVYHRAVRGVLHTVRPISEKFNVYARNAREVNILNTENFGIVGQVEVGALLIGRIVNHNKPFFKKYDEKGYFEFGGSTIVLFFNQPIEFDKDIKKAVEAGYEVKVSAGERIGICLKD